MHWIRSENSEDKGSLVKHTFISLIKAAEVQTLTSFSKLCYQYLLGYLTSIATASVYEFKDKVCNSYKSVFKLWFLALFLCGRVFYPGFLTKHKLIAVNTHIHTKHTHINQICQTSNKVKCWKINKGTISSPGSPLVKSLGAPWLTRSQLGEHPPSLP